VVKQPQEPWSARKYLIEGIIPEKTVNLVAGPADAGKSTWVLKMIVDFLQGKPILNGESHPCPVAYVLTDRSLDDTHERFDRLGLKHPLPFYIHTEKKSSPNITDLPSQIPEIGRAHV